MTYNAFSGMLNLALSIYLPLINITHNITLELFRAAELQDC